MGIEPGETYGIIPIKVLLRELASKLDLSMSEMRRLLKAGAIDINGKRISSDTVIYYEMSPKAALERLKEMVEKEKA